MEASGDSERTLHFFVKVSPAPEGPSMPGPGAVLTALLVLGILPFGAIYITKCMSCLDSA